MVFAAQDEMATSSSFSPGKLVAHAESSLNPTGSGAKPMAEDVTTPREEVKKILAEDVTTPREEVKKILAHGMTSERIDCGGVPVLLRAMTAKDYLSVRALIPSVSTCTTTFEEEDVTAFLSISTFHPMVAVREDEDVLVGYAELYRLPHIGRGFDGRLERVVVDPSFRGKKLATHLCNYIIRQAERLGCGRVDLTVQTDEARHIYSEKLQFIPIQTEVMRRKLHTDG